MRYFREVVVGYTGDDCLLWPFSKSNKGYGTINHDGRNLTVSRFLCAEVNGPPPTPDHVAAHSCGRGHTGCVNPRHLRWATRTENEADKIIHGTKRNIRS